MGFQRSEKIFFFFRKFGFGNNLSLDGLCPAIPGYSPSCLKRLLFDDGFFKRRTAEFYFFVLIRHSFYELERSDDFAGLWEQTDVLQ